MRKKPTAPSNPSKLWAEPVCSELLRTFDSILRNYERGKLASTRDWLDPSKGVIKVPTSYAWQVIFKPIHLQYLCIIMTELAPDSPVTPDIINLRDNLGKGKNASLQTGGGYLVTLWFYKDVYQIIVNTLKEAKYGKPKTQEDIAAEQKQQGKELFEI
jgi:hypothetical protein